MERVVNKRQRKAPLITLIGEGITEQFYFRHIRSLFNLRYVIKPYYFGITSLGKIDLRIAEVVSGGGIAICIFDLDVAHHDETERKKLNSLFRKYGNKKNVIFCTSLPSIEYWFYLHFKNTNRSFQHSSEVEHELQMYITRYEKTTSFLENAKWVSDLCHDKKLEIAIDRARNFGEEGQSYSNVYKAFDLIM